MKPILILNGPNLNMLGSREPGIYGKKSLDDIHALLNSVADELGVGLVFFQSNSEGGLIDRLQAASGEVSGVIFNPGGYTHTSVALRDAISSIAPIPVVEVHLSNVYARPDSFRHHSLLAPVCLGQVSGFGPDSYTMAFRGLVGFLQNQ